MLAANGAVDSILTGGEGKADIWQINAEEEYHEESQPNLGRTAGPPS